MSKLWIPSGMGHCVLSERKSRFIGEAGAVHSMDEVRCRVKELRMEHPRSRHVAWACILGKDASLKSLSDDREPRGTAGRPIMEPIAGRHLTNTLVTVVRYFGGVKLGTGGLVSTYGKCSREALSQMPGIPFVERMKVGMEIEYPVYNPLVSLIQEADGVILEKAFETVVRVTIDLPVAVLDEFRHKVKDLSHHATVVEVV